MEQDEILLIHLGGLGDMCLSESTLLSLRRHFAAPLVGLGYTRFLGLFRPYFDRIERIESTRWLHLFSEYPPQSTWKRIIFIGKDRAGSLRRRWQGISREELIFVDMYPEGEFGGSSSPDNFTPGQAEFGVKKKSLDTLNPAVNFGKVHVEKYQLAQLAPYNIEPVRKKVRAQPSGRVTLYPEVGFKKEKWHQNNFLDLYTRLKAVGIEVCFMGSPGLALDVKEKVSFSELTDVRKFLEGRGGIFVSNDSGMAHLAGICGLATLTIFADFDPLTWHPRGINLSLRCGRDRVDVPTVEGLILDRVRPGR
jgi:ADP-heptose:LPS heptosyltransferase